MIVFVHLSAGTVGTQLRKAHGDSRAFLGRTLAVEFVEVSGDVTGCGAVDLDRGVGQLPGVLPAVETRISGRKALVTRTTAKTFVS